MKKQYIILTMVSDPDGSYARLSTFGTPLETMFLAENEIEKCLDRYPHDTFFIIPQYTKNT